MLTDESLAVVVRGRLVRVGKLQSDSFDPPPAVNELVSSIRANGPRLDVLTLVQTLPHLTPSFPYHTEPDNVAAVPITTFDDWWTRQVDRKTRNIVRKAEKQGVVVRQHSFDEALVQGIHRIYNECPVRHGKRFWHYGKDVPTVRRENASFLARSVFLAACLGDEIIGFAKLVIASDGRQGRLMQILSMTAHRDKSPTNALIAEAVRVCSERRIDYLCYGQFTYGKKQRDSLTDFKENNGFKRFDVPRYYVPLSVVGRAALACGMHHRLADRIPERVLVGFRDARRRWYASSGNTAA